MPLLLDITDPLATEDQIAGSFGAPLARAAQAGAPVPVSVVLTAEACRRLASVEPGAEYHIPGHRATPPEDPAVEALAVAWHVAGCGGVLPVVLHPSPVTPYDHPAGRRDAVPVPTWRQLAETVAAIGRERPAPVVLQREVSVALSGRAYPSPADSGGGLGGEPALAATLPRRQARRVSRLVRLLGTSFRWAVDTTGNLWVLACQGGRVSAPVVMPVPVPTRAPGRRFVA